MRTQTPRFQAHAFVAVLAVAAAYLPAATCQAAIVTANGPDALPADGTSLTLTAPAALITGDGIADFTYNPGTGELAVEPDGQSVWSLNIATLADPSIVNLPEQWGFAEFQGEIEWSDRFAGAFPVTSRFALGTLATGLNATDFGRVLYFTTDSFGEQIGTIEVVPEPGTLAMLAAGGLMITRRRRNAA